jgi:transcriptional regulator with XRE-family HTH domain
MAMNKNKNRLTSLGQRIRDCRIKLGISQEELAFRAGMDRTYISGVERGVRNPTYTSLLAISLGLGTSLSDLLRNIELFLPPNQ